MAFLFRAAWGVCAWKYTYEYLFKSLVGLHVAADERGGRDAVSHPQGPRSGTEQFSMGSNVYAHTPAFMQLIMGLEEREKG